MKNDGDEYLNKVTVGNLEPHNAEITLVEYNTDWPVLFEREAARIREALGCKARQVHHVGSTAVPGLCAKPIVDMLLVVENSANETDYTPYLEAAGYVLRIREPEWFEHRLFKMHGTDINLHVFSENAAEIERMLCFRDWLRNNENDKQLYAESKRELAQHIWRHVQNYADAKTAVIEAIMERASMDNKQWT